MSDIGTAYVNIVPKAEGIKGTLTKEFGSGGDAAGAVAGNSLVGKMKGVIAKAAIGAAVVTGIKKSVSEGAALEQSIGGIETLFKGSADAVIKNAKQAYKTAGISANEYMENVTSFSAGLIKSMGGDTKAAVKVADTAMVDMADNANKMGTDMSSIQNAYQGFAKQNYTMLDNLKLGYGGTKQEMERLLEDAGKLSGQEYDISNLQDVYEAIHVVQGELGITGTTAQEAAQTLSGSFGSMKAAFTDFMGNLALGQDIGPSMKNLVDSTVTFLVGNLIPAVVNIMKSLPEAVISGINALAAYIPKDLANVLNVGLNTVLKGMDAGMAYIQNDALNILTNVLNTITTMLPQFLDQGVKMVVKLGEGIIKNIPAAINVVTQLVAKLSSFIAKNYPKIISAGIKLFGGLAKALAKNAPEILSAIAKLILQIGKSLLQLAPLGLKAGLSLIQAAGKGIGNAIGAVVGKVKDFVSKITEPIRNAVDKIKGFFPLNIGNIFSNFRLPHLSVSGGSPPFGIGGAGSLPKFSVSWYAKGGILTEPTLFGGGEAGDEAIVPLDPFWKRLEKNSGNTFNITMNVNGAEDPENWADRFARRLELATNAE